MSEEKKKYYTENGVTDAGLSALGTTFHDAQIEWRAQTVNTEKNWALLVPYITARAVQSRLDEFCGASNWKSVYREIKSHSKDGETVNMICGISIRCARNDGPEWVTKFDGAQPTDIEGFKGSISGAFRRAAVSWAIGRFLYELEPEFVEISTLKDKSKERLNFKRVWYFYNKPKLPEWAQDKSTEPVIELTYEVAGFKGTYTEILAQMKKDKRYLDGITPNESPLPDAIEAAEKSGNYTDQQIVEKLVKYFEGE